MTGVSWRRACVARDFEGQTQLENESLSPLSTFPLSLDNILDQNCSCRFYLSARKRSNTLIIRSG